MRDNVDLSITMDIVPPVAKRGRHALILLRTPDKKFILGRKTKVYPPGISRMIGGGVEDGETPEEAAQRELYEETGLSANREDLIDLVLVEAIIFEDDEYNRVVHEDGDDTNLTYSFETYVYLYDIGNQTPKYRDDIDGLITLDKYGMQSLISSYGSLSGEYKPELGFSWMDYGKLYGPIHEAALNEAIDLEAEEKVRYAAA